jgi:hypothetical protein
MSRPSTCAAGLAGLVLLAGCLAPASGTPEPTPTSQDGAPIPSLVLPSAAPTTGTSGLDTVDIYLDLYDPDAWSEDEVTCVGEDGYDDIGPGLTFELHDETGELLGSTALREGFVLEPGRCSFHTAIQGVPSAEVYVLTSETRGELRFSAREMEANDWTITMSLGS